MAPPKVSSWSKSNLFQWINFKWVQNFTIQGTGVVDGQGSDWWISTSSSSSSIYYLQNKSNKHIPDWKPTVILLYFYLVLTSNKQNTIYTLMTCIFNDNLLFFLYIEIMQALRFYSSYDVTVRDIRIINSPQCHLKFDSSGGIKVNNITISSPENSPNTDGIHLQNTQNVEIHHSTISCGKNIYIYQAIHTNYI